MKRFTTILGTAIVLMSMLACNSNDSSSKIEPFKQDGKYGYIDNGLDWVIPPQYDYASSFIDGVAEVEVDGKWGLIDEEGNYILKPTYDEFGFDGDNGMRPARINYKWGAVNNEGKLVVALEYDEVGQFVDGVAPVKKNNRWGYVDRNGKLIIPLIYESASGFSNGVGLSGCWGIVRYNGKELGIRKDGTTFTLK